MLPTDKVLVTIGTPCSMSAVGSTDTFLARVADSPEFIGCSNSNLLMAVPPRNAILPFNAGALKRSPRATDDQVLLDLTRIRPRRLCAPCLDVSGGNQESISTDSLMTSIHFVAFS